MSMFSFSSSSSPIAIADIQNGSVSIAIGLAHQDKPFEILAVERSDLSFEDRTEEAAIAALADQIDQAGNGALRAYAEAQQTHGPVAKAFCVINTPWTHSQTIRATTQLDTEQRITDEMITTLAKQALKEASEVDVKELLEASVLRIELNGYPASEPIGKHAHSIAVYGLISDCDPRVRAIVTEALQKIFPVPLLLRSQFRTVLSVTAKLPSIAPEYCLIDITRETTSISNIHMGLSLAHTVVDEGAASILKRISDKTLPEEALALSRMIFVEDCKSPACDALRETIARVEPDIVRAFGEGMVKLVAERYLPLQTVLVCEDAFAPWLSQLFSRIDFTQFTTTTQPLEIAVLDMSSLDAFVKTPSEAAVDMRLALAASLVHIEERKP